MRIAGVAALGFVALLAACSDATEVAASRVEPGTPLAREGLVPALRATGADWIVAAVYAPG